MMKYYQRALVILMVLLFNTDLFAQVPDITWVKYFNKMRDYGNSIQQTTDGGYIIAGTMLTRSGTAYTLLTKTDSNGDTLWIKTFGNGDIEDTGRSLNQTFDSGFIITGRTNSRISLIKTNTDGDTLWTKTISEKHDESEGFSVKQVLDEGFIITGRSGTNAILIKTNSSGDTLWTKTFGFGVGYEVQQTTDEGYIITGRIDSSTCLIKTDSYGDTLWTKIYGKNKSEGRSVQQTTDGGFIISGENNTAAWLIKTDSNGDSLWSKTFWDDGEANSVVQTTDGGYIITGKFTFGVGIYKTNSIGDSLWTIGLQFSFDEVGNSIQQTVDGSYVIVGTSRGLVGTSSIFLIKVATEITSIYETSILLNDGFHLNQNYPNPFNPKTIISYQVGVNDYSPLQVHLSIYNILGQEVAVLVNKKQTTGSYKVEWDAANFPSGIYYYRLTSEYGHSQTRQMVLLK